MTCLPPNPDFDVFFHELWGHSPYPWQRRLAASVAKGVWPDALGVPTGAGKTSAVDIAVHALAAEVEFPPEARRQPRRVLFVVDRRTIVDQAYERSIAIRDRLMAATDGPLAAVAARLRAYMGEGAEREEPLAVGLLRGGLPRDDGWARRPDQPLVAVSTVDQVGSRLLFRGYGVRPTLQSLHAGLVGNDALILLDEVHLSRPFEESLDAIRRYRGWREAELPDRWRFVRLSATSGATDAFALDGDDLADARLHARLTASKPLRIVDVDTPTHKKDGAPAPPWIDAITREARRMLELGRRSVGVVVNRVDTARAVHAALEARGGARVLLVTGRMRPCDRDETVTELVSRAGPGRGDHADGLPFVCVATQCIEAGADLDFDALITELASADALTQRFGRANRTGERGATPLVVLAPKCPDDDPIYSRSLGPALAWIKRFGEDANVGPLALAEHPAPPDALPPREGAAVLLPPHLDMLAQTSQAPDPDPEPAGYLHGLTARVPEVRVVWRADVSLEDPDDADARLTVVPPGVYETLSLPIGAVRRWLQGQAPPSFGDAPARAEDMDSRGSSALVGYVYDGEAWTPARARDIRPNGLIVVPASRGGLRAGTFDPSCTEPVRDVGDLAATLRSGRPLVRVDARVHADLERAWPIGVSTPPALNVGEDTPPSEIRSRLVAWLDSVSDQAPALWRALRTGRRSVLRAGSGWVVVGAPLPREALLLLGQGRASPWDAGLTADDGSSTTGRAVPLSEHLGGVERWARSLATACGLPEALVDDVARAARWHDLGKADPRFQILLHGGDEIRAAGGHLLAKSASGGMDTAARQRAARRARLPGGFRHEMASIALLDSAAGRSILTACHDPELVLHLVASHHGYARPFAPVEDHRGQDPSLRVRVHADGVELDAPADHGADAIDSGVAERFHAVQRRYGWWGLAWLESILRLADHRCSEAETRAAPEAS